MAPKILPHLRRDQLNLRPRHLVLPDLGLEEDRPMPLRMLQIEESDVFWICTALLPVENSAAIGRFFGLGGLWTGSLLQCPSAQIQGPQWDTLESDWMSLK